MGRLSSALGGGMRYDYRYYEGGLLKEKRASGRILTSYTYDAEGNKVGQKDLTGKETGYRYDFSGRLTAVTDMGQCIRKSGRKEDWRKHHKYLWL